MSTDALSLFCDATGGHGETEMQTDGSGVYHCPTCGIAVRAENTEEA